MFLLNMLLKVNKADKIILFFSAQSTPSRGTTTRQRKNVISCVTVADSDGEDHRSPAKPHIQQLQQPQLYHQQQQAPPPPPPPASQQQAQVSLSVHTSAHIVREIKHEPHHRFGCQSTTLKYSIRDIGD